MKFKLKTTGFRIDKPLADYVDLKLVKIVSKFLKGESALAAVTLDIEIEKTTTHHHKGKIWRAEANVVLPHAFFRCEATGEDIREAIDILSDEVARDIKRYKNKSVAKMKRGARAAKRQLKLDRAER